MAFAAGWGHPALRGNTIIPRGRGGAYPARGFAATPTYRANRNFGFPLWGKAFAPIKKCARKAGAPKW